MMTPNIDLTLDAVRIQPSLEFPSALQLTEGQ